MEKIDTAVKQASQSGGVTQSYVDDIRDNLQSAITQLTTRVTADQYDKIKNVSFK